MGLQNNMYLSASRVCLCAVAVRCCSRADMKSVVEKPMSVLFAVS